VKYALDTNVVSALMRSEPAVGARLLAAAPDEVVVPQPVLAELRYGLARLPRSRRRADLESRLGILLQALRRAPWDDAVSARFGRLKAELERKGRPLDDFDLAIAAHALVLDLTLATANVRHFGRVRGLRLEDWTVAATPPSP
jgi:tRNA(fMet)-specific endonuclease VapC